MHRKQLLALGLLGLLAGSTQAQTMYSAPSRGVANQPVSVVPGVPMRPGNSTYVQENGEAAPSAPAADPAAPAPGEGESAGEAAEESGGYGPTPIQKVHILQNWLRKCCGKDPIKDPAPKKKDDPCAEKKPDDPCAPKKEEKKEDACAPKKDAAPCPGACKDAAPAAPDCKAATDDACPKCDCDSKKKDPCLQIFGWVDVDGTYRSTGHGNNPVAPVMNHFGDEFLNRSDGLAISKPLDAKECSWGFNMILIAGSDASFLNPTEGWFHGSDLGPGGSSRYSIMFTDLNLTAHLPILTDGGVDIKAGRQTTIFGPMGALPWQRWFDSSDYAWYNMEEGRYTGVSAIWHITKRLDWYNGIEFGWGTFFADINRDVDYLGNISYWLDKEAKKYRVFTTALIGPTSEHSGKVTAAGEFGFQGNWTTLWYSVSDFQFVNSKGPVNAPVPPGYLEHAYDVYTYLGRHLTKCVDLQSRVEWYRDVEGEKYAGGFGVPKTDYYEVTLGVDYHPYKWMQFRPEVRYDQATNDNFGQDFDKKHQVSVAADLLIKF